jgi:DNA-binding CsgD family transcriptional regulator
MTTKKPFPKQLSVEERRARELKIKTLIESGLRAKEVAAACKCSLTDVYRVKKALGLEFASKRYSDTDQMEIAAYYASHTLKQTAEKFSITTPTVVAYAKRYGVKKRGTKERPSDVLEILGLTITTEPKGQRNKYFLAHPATGKRMVLTYSEVCAVRRDPRTWLKTHAERVNEEMKK